MRWVGHVERVREINACEISVVKLRGPLGRPAL